VKRFLLFGYVAYLVNIAHADSVAEVYKKHYPLTPYKNPSEMDKKPPKKIEEVSKKLFELSNKLEDPESRRLFLDAFPKIKKDFLALCSDLSYQSNTPTGDCHGIILEGLRKTSVSEDTALRSGKIMVNLASEVKFDADAPSYLQWVLDDFCAARPKDFVVAINDLTRAKQEKTLKFMNDNFHPVNGANFISCINALNDKNYFDLSQRARKYVYPNGPVR
jgi:hypothetical protein